MIKFLIEKEFKQLFRNSFLPRLILVFPCMIMILMPWAMNLEIRNVSLNIVDNDHSVTSRRLVDKISASTYFRLTALPDSYDEALKNVEAGDADIILEIPRDFEKDCTVGRSSHVLIAANAVNGTKGSLGGSYLSNIIQSYASEVVVLPARGDTPSDYKKAAGSNRTSRFFISSCLSKANIYCICFQCVSMVELCLRGEEFKLDRYLDIEWKNLR